MTLLIAAGLLATTCPAQQRYLDEVFTAAQVSETPDASFGINIDFMTSDFSNMTLAGPQIVQLQSLVSAQQPIPSPFFDPTDPSTVVKVIDLKMDIYQPDQSMDSELERPMAIYLHAGDCLPPPVNGVPFGTRKDSSAVEICRQLARRGYVAVSVEYRNGWNPIAPTLEGRRGTLINAVYRAIHDAKQALRELKADAATYRIDPDKVIAMGEGIGGYLALSMATLDDPNELYIDKFLPDPFDPGVSYIDSTMVGNLDGFNGQLSLYRPNGFNSDIHFVANLGGAMPDSTWLEPGDVPMIAFHTAFNPNTPFSTDIVYAPGGLQVVEVSGSNSFMQQVNVYGNNAAFATLPGGDTYTDIARARYGQTLVHSTTSATVNTNVEGLFPVVTRDWPALIPGNPETGNPWAWWDPNSPIAQVVLDPGPPPFTTHMNGLIGNPDSSPAFGRAMIDTLMGYLNPRVVCAFDMGPCSLVSVSENDPLSLGVDLFPNPASDQFTVSSSEADMLGFDLYDINGRRVKAENVSARRFTLVRNGLAPGVYFMQLHFNEGNVIRKVILD